MAKSPVIAITITADDKTDKGFRSASASVEGFGSKIGAGAIALGTFAGNIAANALPAAINLGKELFAVGQAAEQMAKKSNVVFGDSAADIAKWADGINESLGISDERVVGLAANMGDLLVPMGFSREAAAELTQESLNAAGALAAWSGGQYDAAQVSEIMTKAMLGERDGLKALGISINQAEVDQRALAIAQADGRTEVTAMDEALATQQLMLEKSADAQTAWADGTMDSVKSQNELSATIDDVKTSLGTALVPMIQSVVKWIVEDMIPAVQNIVATFQEKWPEIQAAVAPVIAWFTETISAFVVLVQELWRQFGERLLEHATNYWNFIRDGIEAALQVIKGIIDVITGLISGDWSKVWEGIKAIAQGVWDGITNLIGFALQTIGLLIDVAWNAVKTLTSNAWEAVKKSVSGSIDAIVGFVTGIPGRIVDTVSFLWEGLKASTTVAKDWVGEKIDEVVEFATGLPGRLVGKFSGMWDGIKIAFKSAINAVIRAWNGLEFSVPGFSAFGKKIGGFTVGVPDIPELARGGIVRATPGGMLARIGEGRYDEAVIPLGPRGANALGANQYTINVAGLTGPQVANDIIGKIREYERRNGAGWRKAA